jgi:hypothetical protein
VFFFFFFFEFCLEQQTALDLARESDKHEIVNFLQPFIRPKPKMFALCMGLHRRLGVDSPLKILNVDVMQEIAKHLPARYS